MSGAMGMAFGGLFRFRLVLLLAAGLLVACGGDSSSGMPVSQAFCDKLGACEGAPLSAADHQACVQEIDVELRHFPVPMPESGPACVTATPCDTFNLSPIDAVLACLEIDPASFTCNGQALRVCTTQGACGDVDCSAYCIDRGDASGACGIGPNTGAPRCLCS
jgi:hypothetical protein